MKSATEVVFKAREERSKTMSKKQRKGIEVFTLRELPWILTELDSLNRLRELLMEGLEFFSVSVVHTGGAFAGWNAKLDDEDSKRTKWEREGQPVGSVAAKWEDSRNRGDDGSSDGEVAYWPIGGDQLTGSQGLKIGGGQAIEFFEDANVIDELSQAMNAESGDSLKEEYELKRTGESHRGINAGVPEGSFPCSAERLSGAGDSGIYHDAAKSRAAYSGNAGNDGVMNNVRGLSDWNPNARVSLDGDAQPSESFDLVRHLSESIASVADFARSDSDFTSIGYSRNTDEQFKDIATESSVSFVDFGTDQPSKLWQKIWGGSAPDEMNYLNANGQPVVLQFNSPLFQTETVVVNAPGDWESEFEPRVREVLLRTLQSVRYT